ncbi:4-(cytidine 5'-diphospho)-2-C-methyl-D-erythritol kinase [Gemmatimonadota bacterium]
MLKLDAPAKVNLFLRVLAREVGGFHQLETLFASLEFGDTLTFRKREEAGVSLDTDGPHMGPPEENLVYRAAVEFLDRSGVEGGVEIHLKKRIPLQGGLGGGSSDAAATLRGLRDLFPGRLDEASLLEVAGALGSDVPFLLVKSSLALAWGRGDRLLPLPPLPSIPVLLAFPPLGVDTSEAYGLLAKNRGERPSDVAAKVTTLEDLTDWEGVRVLARNDFQEALFPAFPLLSQLHEALLDQGPLFALLAGSGASLFATFTREEDARLAQGHLEAGFPDTRFLLTRTLATPEDPSPEVGVEP